MVEPTGAVVSISVIVIHRSYTESPNRLVAAKSRDYPGLAGAADVSKNVLVEVESQKGTFADWGISLEEVENTPESIATTAYGGYLLDVGIHGMFRNILSEATENLT